MPPGRGWKMGKGMGPGGGTNMGETEGVVWSCLVTTVWYMIYLGSFRYESTVTYIPSIEAGEDEVYENHPTNPHELIPRLPGLLTTYIPSLIWAALASSCSPRPAWLPQEDEQEILGIISWLLVRPKRNARQMHPAIQATRMDMYLVSTYY